ncbi:unnamed protein product [Sphagnum troendelagicum]
MDSVRLSKLEPQQSEDSLPMPGFRFHPTDEELVAYYLPRQLRRKRLPVAVITQLDIYKYDPWDLPKLATVGEKEWFFFCPRDRKYRNSLRPNRVTDSGFWKATGTDRPIYSTEGAKCIGLKKSLVFYKGRAAKGVKTDWMMHEFRLPASTTDAAHTLTQNDGWAVCRIFKKTKVSQKHKQIGTGTSHELASTTVDQPQESLGVQSQYLSVESKDQDSDSVGDDPEASDDMISDFNSEGTSPAETVKDLPPAEMTPFEHLILCDESGRRSNITVPTDASAFSLPEEHLYETSKAGLEAPTSELKSSHLSPLGRPTVEGGITDSTFNIGSTTSSVMMASNRFPRERNYQIFSDKSSNATELSPSTRNTLELVQSILSPSIDYGIQHRGSNETMSERLKTAQNQDSTLYVGSTVESGESSMQPIGEQPDPGSMPELTVRVPQHVREFLDNLPPWDFSPLFISPPTLAFINNSMNHSQDQLFDQD